MLRGFAQKYAMLGESYFYAMIGVELALVMLAAPAATAGAICLDRARARSHTFLSPTCRTPRSSWANWPRGSRRPGPGCLHLAGDGDRSLLGESIPWP